jgi:ligand-binding sensor domain-containing protein
MNIAQDPKDEKHYFVTSYGTGLYEMYEDSIINTYLPSNSPLMSADEKKPTQFTRTDAITYDKEGNLWLLNVGGGDIKNIHVITSEGKWRAYQAKYRGKSIEMHTPGEIMIDQRNPKWKWIPLLRYNTGLILLDDNGTPTNENDDMVTYRTEFVDQNKNHILPNQIYTIAQDKNNVIWIGTDDGILAIPPQVDFTKSNSCIRVIIPRNDGTNLGDYLLDNEQINDIQIDGANRLWVGTANSGIFLLEPTMEDVAHPNYYVETVAHFTTENSILPSDAIMSIAIQQSTGEVFIGTGGGLVSYMSDASEPENDLKQIEVYPNPVRPDYGGYITFKGLMENTELRIVDANGSLVRVIQSNGGTATWDAKNAQGGRVASGVYTAIGNTQDGQAHGTVKVLIMN